MKSRVSSFKKAIDDMSKGVCDFTNDGECTQCGGCCSNLLPMTKEEIDEIHVYIKKHGIKEFKHASNVFATLTLDLTCPFLNDDKEKEKCSIYPVRPRICRDFICCSKKRPKPCLEWASKAKPTNVRKEFFGKNDKTLPSRNR